MAYTKQTWADLPSKTTPINATRLTHIEDGIFNAAQTADTAASTAGTAAANVGIVSGKVETLTGRVNDLDTAVSNKVDKVTGKGLSTNDYTNTDKAKVDALGTASTKNSTSVVTQSTDLVESGAVKDIIGWSDKNKLPVTIDKVKALNTAGTWSGNAYTRNDITFAVSTDESGNVTEIDANGNSGSGYTYFTVANMNIGSEGMNSIDNPHGNGYTLSAGDTIPLIYSASSYNFVFSISANITLNHKKLYPMLELGDTATAYEPYHASVADSLETKADNSVIGTVEDGTNPTKAYAVGEHMVRGGKFCTVTVAVTTSSTWTLGSNYVEGTIADNLVKRDTFSGTTSDIGAVVIYSSNDRVILSAEVVGYTTSLYKRSAGYGCVVKTPQGEALINTAVSLTYYYI